MTVCALYRYWTLLWLITVGLTMSGCAGPTYSISKDERPIEVNEDHHGIPFVTTTSRPIPFTLAPGSKIGLLHEDRDETDRQVRVALEQAIFSLKASVSNLIVVERRSVGDLEAEFRFQASGKVKDQDLAKIGHFLGLDYVVVFDSLYHDLNELYGLRNQIDTWEVTLPLKIIAVNTAEMKLHCLATATAHVGKQMTAVEVRLLNQEALSVATALVSQCLSSSLQGASLHRENDIIPAIGSEGLTEQDMDGYKMEMRQVSHRGKECFSSPGGLFLATANTGSNIHNTGNNGGSSGIDCMNTSNYCRSSRAASRSGDAIVAAARPSEAPAPNKP